MNNTPLSPEMKDAFSSLACRLSPENLSCDGELSRSEVNRRWKALTAQWKALERQAGREVDESELYR